MSVRYVPEGMPVVAPYLIIAGVDATIRFLEDVFEAELVERLSTPDGNVMHAQLRISDSVIMMGEASSKWPAIPGSLHVYVPDVDATYARALEVGADSVMPPADQFYGDRSAGVKDKSGNVWWLATHKEEVSPEETRRRLLEQPPS